MTDATPQTQPTIEERIAAIIAVLETARPMPLSASVVVNRDELVDDLTELLDALPDEMRGARWLLKERDEYLAAARAEASEIIEAATHQVEQMVQRAEVVRSAEARAARLRSEAEAEGRRHRRETEDWCEQRLAQFDTTLAKVAAAVQQGRQRLRELPRADPDAIDEQEIDLTEPQHQGVGQMLFDQDDF